MVHVYADIRVGNIDMISLFHDRQYFYLCKGCLPAVCIVEGAETNKAMRTLFYGEGSIRIRLMHDHWFRGVEGLHDPHPFRQIKVPVLGPAW